MSNRRKLKARRVSGAPPQPGPGEGYAMVPGIVPDRHAPGAVDHARQVTHDTLIRLWGDRRRSGIWWTEHRGLEGKRTYLAFYEHAVSSYEGPEPEALAIFENNPNVTVIVAWAITTEGGAPHPTDYRGWVR